jgi:hypothetical protein
MRQQWRLVSCQIPFDAQRVAIAGRPALPYRESEEHLTRYAVRTTGSDVLPRLFGASLPITLVAAPAASAFLGRAGVSRDSAVHQLYRILAASIVGGQLYIPNKSAGKCRVCIDGFPCTQ